MYLISIWGYSETIRIEGIRKFQLNQFLEYSKKNFKNIAKILLNGDLGFNWTDYDSILSLKAPLIDITSELSITEYDSEDYYADGYTFIRVPLNQVKVYKKKSILDYFDEDFFVMSIQSDYGSSFTGSLKKSNNEKLIIDNFSVESIDFSPMLNQNILSNLYYHDKKLINFNKHGYDNHQLKVLIVKKNKSNEYDIIDKSSVVF